MPTKFKKYDPTEGFKDSSKFDKKGWEDSAATSYIKNVAEPTREHTVSTLAKQQTALNKLNDASGKQAKVLNDLDKELDQTEAELKAEMRERSANTNKAFMALRSDIAEDLKEQEAEINAAVETLKQDADKAATFGASQTATALSSIRATLSELGVSDREIERLQMLIRDGRLTMSEVLSLIVASLQAVATTGDIVAAGDAANASAINLTARRVTFVGRSVDKLRSSHIRAQARLHGVVKQLVARGLLPSGDGMTDLANFGIHSDNDRWWPIHIMLFVYLVARSIKMQPVNDEGGWQNIFKSLFSSNDESCKAVIVRRINSKTKAKRKGDLFITKDNGYEEDKEKSASFAAANEWPEGCEVMCVTEVGSTVNLKDTLAPIVQILVASNTRDLRAQVAPIFVEAFRAHFGKAASLFTI